MAHIKALAISVILVYSLGLSHESSVDSEWQKVHSRRLSLGEQSYCSWYRSWFFFVVCFLLQSSCGISTFTSKQLWHLLLFGSTTRSKKQTKLEILETGLACSHKSPKPVAQACSLCEERPDDAQLLIKLMRQSQKTADWLPILPWWREELSSTTKKSFRVRWKEENFSVLEINMHVCNL